MFGHPDYFQTKPGRLPAPNGLSGWLFYAFWGIAIIGPCVGMLAMGKIVETAVWLVIASLWFSADLFFTARQVRRKAEMDNLFYVGEEDSHVSTKNYDLNLRNSDVDSRAG